MQLQAEKKTAYLGSAMKCHVVEAGCCASVSEPKQHEGGAQAREEEHEQPFLLHS
jgi:hypothetical protein